MITIIIKGTDGCNFNCSYCSLGKKENFQFVSKNRLVEILDYGCRIALNRNDDRISFILHGGEPTLVDVKTYDEALEEIANRYPHIKKEYSMQTNAGKLTDQYLHFLKKYNVRVGVSIDGSKQIHDAERVNISGLPTYDVVCNNIEVLQKNQIPVSCLMVLTSNAIHEKYDFLEYFAQHNLHLKINPLLNYGEVYDHPELSLKQGDYAKYIIGMYEYILENQLDISVSPIDKILYAVLNKTSVRECTFNSLCNNNFLCIDYKGDIYPCGKYSDLNEYKLSNVDDNVLDIFNCYIIKGLIERRTISKPEICNKCKYVKLCNSACNAEASIDGDINSEPLLCADYKTLFEYFSRTGLLVYKKYLLNRKEQLQKREI